MVGEERSVMAVTGLGTGHPSLPEHSQCKALHSLPTPDLGFDHPLEECVMKHMAAMNGGV
jgi:hypothetical protein